MEVKEFFFFTQILLRQISSIHMEDPQNITILLPSYIDKEKTDDSQNHYTYMKPDKFHVTISLTSQSRQGYAK